MTGHLPSILVLPTTLWQALFAGGALPVIVIGLAALTTRGQGLTSRLTLAGLAVFGLGVGLMAWLATAAVLGVGLAELERRYLRDVVLTAGELAAPVDAAPRLALLRTANPAIKFAGVVRLNCQWHCLIVADAEAPAMRAFLEQPAREWTGGSGPAVIEGNLFALVPAAIRDSRGSPAKVLVTGIDAGSATMVASRVAWRSLLTGWLLLGLVALATRRLTTVSVTRRVRLLMERVVEPGSGNRSTGGDELAELGVALDAAIAASLERDRRQNAKYRQMVDNAPYGIGQIDRQGSLVACNAALAKLTGAETPADLMVGGLRPSFVHPEEFDTLVTRVSAGAADLEPSEHDWKGPGGKSLAVRIAARTMPDGAEWIVEDVTDRRALEAQFRQAHKMEALGQLTGGVAHDFNNLLTVILVAIAEIRDLMAHASIQVLEDMAAIEHAAERGAALIRKLLVFSRADEVKPRPVRLASIIDESVPLIRHLLSPGIRLVAPPIAVEGTITADGLAVEQILLNLAANARDAMPAGGEVRLEVRREMIGVDSAERMGLRAPGSYLLLSLTDSGCGIPPEVLPRVMDPFFTTKPLGSGNGLGLAMVYGLMRRHHGAVHIESVTQEGTTVSLFFPEVGVLPTPVGSEQTSGEPEPAGELILLAEDEPTVRWITRVFLERMGYAVDAANDGQEALALLRSGRPYAVVITDALMPVMGGPELLRRARASGCSLPFILVSGHPMENLQLLANQDGRAWALAKPWSVDQLGRLLGRAIRTGAAMQGS